MGKLALDQDYLLILSVLLQPICAPGGQCLLPGTCQVPVHPFLLLKETVPAGVQIAFLFHPHKACHSPETNALHCHSIKPLGHHCFRAFPGTTKGCSLSCSLFPGGRSSGVQAPSSHTEQGTAGSSHRAVLAACGHEPGTCRTLPAKVK